VLIDRGNSVETARDSENLSINFAKWMLKIQKSKVVTSRAGNVKRHPTVKKE
jgi:hypothetical protein